MHIFIFSLHQPNPSLFALKSLYTRTSPQAASHKQIPDTYYEPNYAHGTLITDTESETPSKSDDLSDFRRYYIVPRFGKCGTPIHDLEGR